MSSPRAATSVATMSPVRPDLKFSSVSIRAFCDMSPWIAPTAYPCRASICSTRDASFLYSAKISTRASVAPLVDVFLCASERSTASSR